MTINQINDMRNRRSTLLFRLVWLACIVISFWLVWQWGIRSFLLLRSADTMGDIDDPDRPPSVLFVQRMSLYEQAAQKSPIMRRFAHARAADLLTKQINPGRIERTFRHSLSVDTLNQWHELFREWEQLLKKLERMFPAFALEANRAYLYLQAGQLDLILQWSEQSSVQIPQSRQEILLHIWLGHGAFWSGHPERARRHYEIALKAVELSPRLERRTTHNWRIPAELSTALYHLGLMDMRDGQPSRALAYFRRMLERWEAVRADYWHSNLWYLAQLWIAAAATDSGQPDLALRHLQQARAFPRDPTLRFFAEARLSPRPALQTIRNAHRRHRLSYADSHAIASLQLAAEHLEAGELHRGYRLLNSLITKSRSQPWPSTLDLLAAKDTSNLRFIPASPQLYARLLRLISQLEPKLMKLALLPETSPRHALLPETSPRPALLPETSPRPALLSETSPRPALLSETSSRPVFAGVRVLDMVLELRIYRAFSYLKIYDWVRGERELLQILKLDTDNYPAHKYLGMLAIAKEQFGAAYQHLYRCCNNRMDSVGVIYLAYATIRHLPEEASALLKQIAVYARWRSAIQVLHRCLTGELPQTSVLSLARFWLGIIGTQGLLAQFDPDLEHRSKFWQVKAQVGASAYVLDLFRSLHVGHLASGFSLSTWISRYRYLATFHLQSQPLLAREYLRRLHYLQSFYHRLPHQWYLLDRTLYNQQWGTIAIGLF